MKNPHLVSSFPQIDLDSRDRVDWVPELHKWLNDKDRFLIILQIISRGKRLDKCQVFYVDVIQSAKGLLILDGNHHFLKSC